MYSRSPPAIERGLSNTNPASQVHTIVERTNQAARNLYKYTVNA